MNRVEIPGINNVQYLEDLHYPGEISSLSVRKCVTSRSFRHKSYLHCP